MVFFNPLLSLTKHCSNKEPSIRLLSGFKNLLTNKADIKLGDSSFWDEEYSKAKSTKTEWYINSRQAAGFVQNILLHKNIIHPARPNIVVEIGCGMSPVVLPLSHRLRKTTNMKLTYFATDASTVCIEKLKSSYSDHAASFKSPKLPVLRTDIQHTSPTFLTKGVFACAVDIKNFKQFTQTLRYFPISDIKSYTNQLSNSDINSYKTNIITVDKGCLDAIIWDENSDLVRKVLKHSDSVVSISGEDPDVRVDYFQEKFGKLFSVHLLSGVEVFGYSYVKK